MHEMRMYQPPHFIETDRDVLHALIRARPLGLLISATPEGPVADSIPMLLDADVGPSGRLRAHVARANPHWKIIRDNAEMPVLVVFQGVDSYVTPSWYETKRDTGKVVPTWNYATVQVRGKARAIEDTAWLGQQIRDLTGKHEAGRPEPWAVDDAPERYIEAQLRGIVGIEIDIAEIHGKWKVSQNRPEADRIGVARGLAELDGAAEITALVRRYGKLG